MPCSRVRRRLRPRTAGPRAHAFPPKNQVFSQAYNSLQSFTIRFQPSRYNALMREGDERSEFFPLQRFEEVDDADRRAEQASERLVVRQSRKRVLEAPQVDAQDPTVVGPRRNALD